MNGMTHASSEGSDDSRGVVFDWDNVDRFYEQEIVPAARDFSEYDYLSFRACQGTRHPQTTSELGDLTFAVTTPRRQRSLERNRHRRLRRRYRGALSALRRLA